MPGHVNTREHPWNRATDHERAARKGRLPAYVLPRYSAYVIREQEAADAGYEAWVRSVKWCLPPPVCPYQSPGLARAWHRGGNEAFKDLYSDQHFRRR